MILTSFTSLAIGIRHRTLAPEITAQVVTDAVVLTAFCKIAWRFFLETWNSPNILHIKLEILFTPPVVWARMCELKYVLLVGTVSLIDQSVCAAEGQLSIIINYRRPTTHNYEIPKANHHSLSTAEGQLPIIVWVQTNYSVEPSCLQLTLCGVACCVCFNYFCCWLRAIKVSAPLLGAVAPADGSIICCITIVLAGVVLETLRLLLGV